MEVRSCGSRGVRGAAGGLKRQWPWQRQGQIAGRGGSCPGLGPRWRPVAVKCGAVGSEAAAAAAATASGGRGKVYLVGAGPGHRQYLTVRAHELLSRVAEAVVYDDLSDDASTSESSALGLIRASAEVWKVGKRGGDPRSARQEDIDALLVRLAKDEGKQVVRLKGGDPFVFGRASSELEALRAAGVDVEIVPGVSSCLAAPLLAGIPVTDRAEASSFAVATGHAPETVDWAGLRGADTLVVLMAASTLDDLCRRLVADGGRDPATPAAVVHAAGTDRQRVLRATLATLPAAAAAAVRGQKGRTLSPSVLVIGNVVALATGFPDSVLAGPALGNEESGAA